MSNLYITTLISGLILHRSARRSTVTYMGKGHSDYKITYLDPKLNEGPLGTNMYYVLESEKLGKVRHISCRRLWMGAKLRSGASNFAATTNE